MDFKWRHWDAAEPRANGKSQRLEKVVLSELCKITKSPEWSAEVSVILQGAAASYLHRLDTHTPTFLFKPQAPVVEKVFFTTALPVAGGAGKPH